MKNSDQLIFKGNGKLLITGEYTILDGAIGLAIPTKFNQTLTVQKHEKLGVYWESRDKKENNWFKYHFSDLNIKTSPNTIENTLLNILLAAKKMNPKFLSAPKLKVTTRVDFDRNWGLGTSSTLIYCISQWAQIDPYDLLFNTIGGSGYDIACAGNDTPILYTLNAQKPIVESIRFAPPFKEQLYFVYLNKKQSSSKSLNNYKHLNFNRQLAAKKITEITKQIIKATHLDQFETLLYEHEAITAEILQQKRVKDLYFKDFWGAIKSLGAWGGDFVLITSNQSKEATKDYFKQKGYNTFLSYQQMVLNG